MNIALIYPPWTLTYGSFSILAKKSSTFHPLGLAYLGAIAEEMGHKVRIIDGEAENISLEKIVDETIKFNPNMIGITATTPFYHISIDLSKKLKQEVPKIPLLVGGPHITVLKEKTFDDCFDYAFIGESDKSWSKFLKKFENGGDLSKIEGILYRKGGDIKFTGYSEPLNDLDSIPFPARHLLKMDKYYMGTLNGMKNYATLMSVRGCPFKCIFCNTEVFGEGVRRRSPKKVIEEIKSVKENYGINHFYFIDETFTLSKKHILDMCNLIDNKKLDITFEASTRPNLVDEELIARLANSGMIRISFGLESVDEGIRKLMKKEVPLESYIEANKLTNKYGIETLNSCMIGLPGETEETIKKTLKFLRESREIKQANLSIAVPYPGTELYRMAKREEHGLKLMTEDWVQYRRYNSAVMKVGDLSPEDLIDLQNEGIVSIFLAPWRWKTMIHKSGIKGVCLTLKRLFKCIWDKRGKTRFLTNKQLGIKKK